ncbi:hypothetical protein [Cellulomonas marina]|uniref:Uncharacterized protein n=1 Tax=Cellulomonas marina TaxID=988821 RepID=A0A1I0XXX5_9CELL|nr:hypothetical protein [Cellulomonas marina]GIG28454.1 hypothetical protein Cma02nite_10540 [Cellulomonas marina]SFB05999.1 hypothetical protein SAMN05421867_10664 [Cellulomonas marina]
MSTLTATHPHHAPHAAVAAALNALHDGAERGHDLVERVRTTPLPEPTGVAGRVRRAVWVAVSSAALGGGALLVTGLLAGVVDVLS